MSDFLSGAGAVNSAWQASRNHRRGRRTNASNVIVVSEAKPRRDGGYKLSLEVLNRSAVGISHVTVAVEMVNGELELDDTVSFDWTWRLPRALAGGDGMTTELPHIVRLSEESFELSSGAPSAYRCRLNWADDQGKWWERIDEGLATSARRPPVV